MIQQQQKQCRQHTKEELTLYCKNPSCKIPCCGTCALVQHNGHQLCEIASAVEEIVSDMQLSCAIVESQKTELLMKRKSIETAKQAITASYKKKGEELTHKVQTLQNFISMCHINAVARLKQVYESEMSTLSSTTDSIDSLTAQMTSACEFAQQA